MKKVVLVIFLTSILLSCNQNLRINDVIVTKRLFSPDSSYVALTYYIDRGAIGESSSMTSILKVNDTLKQINRNLLPCFDLSFYSCYYPDKWIDNETLQVFLNERPFVREGISFDGKDIVINGITCKVRSYDISENLSPIIENVIFSEDKTKIIVCYRYNEDYNVSVIKYGNDLPRIGNVYTTTEISFNPIEQVNWNGNGNEIDMYLKDAKMFKKSDYINKKIPYKINFIDIDDVNKTQMITKYSENSTLIADLLFNNGKRTNALITKSLWKEEKGKSLFYYEYEYKVGKHKFRNYFKDYRNFEEGEMYKLRDSISIIYDLKQPLVHNLENNYKIYK